MNTWKTALLEDLSYLKEDRYNQGHIFYHLSTANKIELKPNKGFFTIAKASDIYRMTDKVMMMNKDRGTIKLFIFRSKRILNIFNIQNPSHKKILKNYLMKNYKKITFNEIIESNKRILGEKLTKWHRQEYNDFFNFEDDNENMLEELLNILNGEDYGFPINYYSIMSLFSDYIKELNFDGYNESEKYKESKSTVFFFNAFDCLEFIKKENKDYIYKIYKNYKI